LHFIFLPQFFRRSGASPEFGQCPEKARERKTGNLAGEYEMSLDAWKKRPADRFKDKDNEGKEMEGLLVDGKQEQYSVWEMKVMATATGQLTGLCLPGRDLSNRKAPRCLC
jgi:hypothetical protein